MSEISAEQIQALLRQATNTFDEVFSKDVRIAQRCSFLDTEVLQKLYEGHASEIVANLYHDLAGLREAAVQPHIQHFNDHAEHTYLTFRADVFPSSGLEDNLKKMPGDEPPSGNPVLNSQESSFDEAVDILKVCIRKLTGKMTDEEAKEKLEAILNEELEAVNSPCPKNEKMNDAGRNPKKMPMGHSVVERAIAEVRREYAQRTEERIKQLADSQASSPKRTLMLSSPEQAKSRNKAKEFMEKEQLKKRQKLSEDESKETLK